MTIRISAGVVFRDDWEILKLSIANLCLLGVSRFFVIDHLSNEDRAREVIASLGTSAEITFLKKTTTPFLQGRMMSLLATLAKDEGFDVFIPFDADEFHDAIDGLQTSFSAELESWFSGGEASHLHLPVRDYVQASDVLVFDGSSLRTATWRVSSELTPSEWEEYVRRGGSALIHRKRSKIIVRLSGRNAPALPMIEEGSHALESCGDECGEGHSWSTTLLVRHLPFYAAEVVARKRTHRAGRLAAGFSIEIGLQNNVLQEISDSDSAIWMRNSQTDGFAGDTDVSLDKDDGLIELYRRLVDSGFTQEKKALRGNSRVKSREDRSSDNLIQKAFEWALDNSIGFPDLERLRLESAQSESEITRANNDAAHARSKLEELYRSKSWRWTSLFRSISRALNRVRKGSR